MASGLVCRANRPNTWLHRPACKREEKPCQLGAVHTWHKADRPRYLPVCPLSEQSGHRPVIGYNSLNDSEDTAGATCCDTELS
jgi:hypothetical protein